METKQKSNNFIILSASFYRAYFLLPSPVTIAAELTENGWNWNDERDGKNVRMDTS